MHDPSEQENTGVVQITIVANTSVFTGVMYKQPWTPTKMEYSSRLQSSGAFGVLSQSLKIEGIDYKCETNLTHDKKVHNPRYES